MAALAGAIGFTQISVSHRVSPLMKLVPRGDTTVVDAYLSPILRRYVDRVGDALGGVRLMFMRSRRRAHRRRAVPRQVIDPLRPAGGVVGMAGTGRAAGFSRVIGFDMGGTSTDVAHFDGSFERAFETQVAGVRIAHRCCASTPSPPAVARSCTSTAPASASARSPPAPIQGRPATTRGGPLTVTDANVLLGRIQPAHFPAIFGPDGDESLDAEVVRKKFAALAAEINAATSERRSAEAVAEGFLRIAVENMANAIKTISVQRGHDVARYLLNCFGGAGGQRLPHRRYPRHDQGADPPARRRALGVRDGAGGDPGAAPASGRGAAQRGRDDGPGCRM
ncbi:MAG: hydantoinase/oxoprolinase family protein [Rhodospirillales bacterium]